ncbi:hypothetical protein ACFYV7_03885 [Nocardia suismassiliense]|uniref:Uncharacterized protein n=1 Tax=Nocardia suismassiliense TaxID=2077092 RepID=A0ABW6QLR2_9NOCA|nr:hypothetical protein [Nocardia sp. XZ_19_369]
MKRSLAGAVLVGALLIPGQFVGVASASAAPTAAVVADSGSGAGSSQLGCTSNTNPTCPGWVKALTELLTAISTGSAKGGK